MAAAAILIILISEKCQ